MRLLPSPLRWLTYAAQQRSLKPKRKTSAFRQNLPGAGRRAWQMRPFHFEGQMPRFRADFEVKGSLVLPVGSDPVVLQGDNPKFELTIRNDDTDADGHVRGLVAQIVAESDSIDRVPDAFRTILAEQLDVLSFATHSAFEIVECRRVLEWEPYQKTRKLRPMKSFDPHYPPAPDLNEHVLHTTQKIIAAARPSEVTRALRCFRYGVIQRQPEDQFQQFL